MTSTSERVGIIGLICDVNGGCADLVLVRLILGRMGGVLLPVVLLLMFSLIKIMMVNGKMLRS